jgi:hypothetical protein
MLRQQLTGRVQWTDGERNALACDRQALRPVGTGSSGRGWRARHILLARGCLHRGPYKAFQPEDVMMHSPFPGMDPYLEAPSIWPDVHTTLMSIFREQLTPLLAPDPPVPLDLGQALRTAYARARYDLRVDYRKPLVPPLSPAAAAWAAALIGASGERAPQGGRGSSI